MAASADANISLKSTVWLFGLMVALFAMFLVARWTSWSVELTPDHSDVIFATASWTALIGGAGAIVAVLWFKPTLRYPPLPSAIVIGPVFALMVFLTTMSIAETIFQRLDFSHGSTERFDGNLSIARAYVSSGRGWHYHVQLVEFAPTLDVNKTDYHAAFGTAKDARSRGWCLLAKLEHNGEAMRVLLNPRWPFAAGRIVRCLSTSSIGPASASPARTPRL